MALKKVQQACLAKRLVEQIWQVEDQSPLPGRVWPGEQMVCQAEVLTCWVVAWKEVCREEVPRFSHLDALEVVGLSSEEVG